MNSKPIFNCYCFSMFMPDGVTVWNIKKKLAAFDDIRYKYDVIGVYEEPREDAIVIFIKELNDAKTMRNELIAAGYVCGRNIMTAYVNADLTDVEVIEPEGE